MTTFTEIFGGSTIYPSEATFLSLTMGTNQTLAWPIEQQVGGNIVADIIEVNATAPGLTITFPDARQVSTGFTALINNIGANTININNSIGGSIISLVSGSVWQVYLYDNSTAAGSWRTFQYGASVSVTNAAALAGAGLKAILTSLNLRIAVMPKSVDYTAVDSDRATLLNWGGGAGTINLPLASSVGADWFVYIRNSGSGSVTVQPPAGTIDGAATKVFALSGSAAVVCDGSNYYTLGYGVSGAGTSFDYVSLNVAGTGDFTLSGANLNRISYKLTGILTGNRNLIVPNTVQQYWVDNETTGAFTLTVKTAAGTGVAIAQGNKAITYCDGTNVIAADSASISFPLTVAQGGTNATTASAALSNLGGVAIGAAIAVNVGASYGVSIQPTTNAFIPGLNVKDNAGTRKLEALYVGAGASTTYGALVSSAVINASGANGLTISTQDLARIFISGAGNVTVNVPTSGIALTVTAFLNSTAALFTGNGVDSIRLARIDADAPYLSFYKNGSTRIGYIQFTSGGTSVLAVEENQPFIIQTNTTTRLTVAAAGNITFNAPASGTHTINLLTGANLKLSTGAASSGAGIELAQSGQTSVFVYQPASTDSLALYAGGANRIVISSAGDVTGRGIALTKWKTATTTRASNTTATDDPHLVQVLPAGTYAVEMFIPMWPTGATAGGFKWAVNFTGTVTEAVFATTGVANSAQIAILPTTLMNGGTQVVANIQGANNAGSDYLYIIGTLVATGSGTLSFMWAQNSSNVSGANVNTGAYMRCTQVS